MIDLNDALTKCLEAHATKELLCDAHTQARLIANQAEYVKHYAADMAFYDTLISPLAEQILTPRGYQLMLVSLTGLLKCDPPDAAMYLMDSTMYPIDEYPIRDHDILLIATPIDDERAIADAEETLIAQLRTSRPRSDAIPAFADLMNRIREMCPAVGSRLLGFPILIRRFGKSPMFSDGKFVLSGRYVKTDHAWCNWRFNEDVTVKSGLMDDLALSLINYLVSRGFK